MIAVGTMLLNQPILEHNNYLTLLMTMGIVGLLSYCTFLGALFKSGIHLIHRANNKFQQYYGEVAVEFIVAYIVISFFTHVINKVSFQMYFSTIIGILIGLNILKEKEIRMEASKVRNE